jgi:hypothetical protein
MYYSEIDFMDNLDKWDDRDRRERFRHKMEHKLNAKEQYYSQSSSRH